MSDPKIVIVSTGSANIASVVAAFDRCGKECVVTENRDDIAKAKFVVLPGVGSFKSAINSLQQNQLVEPLRERILSGRPTLTICLGMQLLAESSAESPEVKGLRIISESVIRLNSNLPVPQIGWNSIESNSKSSVVKSGFAYFANSFVLKNINDDWIPSYSIYGVRFLASFERAGVLACQFHPELSGRWGHELLLRWLKKGEQLC